MMSKSLANISNKYDRIVVLIDMDCFYCQVEEILNPELRGKPIAVVQYNAWRGGGIIAVNYPARAKGVTRHMRGDEAKAQCPDIELVKVPNIREKADLSKYRNAGKQVAAVLQTYTPILSRASVDEAYLDITEQVQNRLMEMNQGKFSLQPNSLKNTFAVGYENIGEYVQDISDRITKSSSANAAEFDGIPDEDRKAYKKSDIRLLIAASIATEMRAAVKDKTGYECSAGIAHNKVLAKLVCGINKPNKQTILPLRHIHDFFKTLPVNKVQGLGGKFGEQICKDLSIKFMAELIDISKEELQDRYDEQRGQWLYNIARGIDLEIVTPRLISKSIGCCKKFPGKNAITTMATLNHWLHELAQEISERLEQDEEENNRKPKQMVVSFLQTLNNIDLSSSRTVNLTTIDEEKIVADAIDVLKRNTDKFFKSTDNMSILNNPIKFLGLNVGKFESLDTKRGNTIQNMFERKIESKKNEPSSSTTKMENHDEGSNEQISEPNDKCNENEEKTKSIENKSATETKSDTNIGFFAKYRLKLIEQQRLDAENALKNGDQTQEESSNNEESENEDDSVINKPEDIEQSSTHRSNSPVASTSKDDYTKTYAEFYRPSTSTLPNIPKVKCNQCGKMINDNEHDIQIHNDEHYAFQVSQELRIENQLKRTIPTETQVAAKKPKVTNSTKSQTPIKLPSIHKFFPKTNDNEPIASTSKTHDDADMEKCEECGKRILCTELFEHMDFHAAEKLRDELMKADLSNRMNNNNMISDKKVNKSKKKTTNNCKATTSNSNAIKDIASFFQNPKDTI